jgi:hypothetical protein
MIHALPPLAPSQSLTVVRRATSEEQCRFGSTINTNCKTKPTSAFIAQLLASKHAASAFRQKRRCSPLEARSAYLATKTRPLACHDTGANLHINFQA